MAPKPLSPYLYLYEKTGREPVWVIRTRQAWRSTSCAIEDREKAEEVLAKYTANPRLYRKPRKRWEHPDSRLYFIEALAGDRPIKIGVAKDVTARMWNLRVGSPFDMAVLASVPGGTSLEVLVHKQLKASRIRGEWYRRTPEVEAAIAAANTGTLNGWLMPDETPAPKAGGGRKPSRPSKRKPQLSPQLPKSFSPPIIAKLHKYAVTHVVSRRGKVLLP